MLDRIVLVGMALTALKGQTEPSSAGGCNTIDHGVVAEFERVDPTFFIEHGIAMKAGGDTLLWGGMR